MFAYLELNAVAFRSITINIKQNSLIPEEENSHTSLDYSKNHFDRFKQTLFKYFVELLLITMGLKVIVHAFLQTRFLLLTGKRDGEVFS